jgi:uncharacterized membrane protein YqgA involved in biofilm formation
LVNSIAIIAGSLVGLVFRGAIPQENINTVMHSISLAVILIGLKGALKSEAILLIILCLAVGTAVGEFLKIEEKLDRIGKWLEISISGAGVGISKGFVSATLIFCVGSMAIVGSLESGLAGNHQTLYAKSVLDGIASIVFASSFGIGVIFSAISVLVYQGFITLTATMMKQILLPEIIDQMSAVGGLLIMAIGFNMLEIKRIRVGNMLPSIILPLLYYIIKQIVILIYIKF